MIVNKLPEPPIRTDPNEALRAVIAHSRLLLTIRGLKLFPNLGFHMPTILPLGQYSRLPINVVFGSSPFLLDIIVARLETNL